MLNLGVSEKKEFSDILSDYDFFKTNCNEDENMLSIFVREIMSFVELNSFKFTNENGLKLLDFGSGDGKFLESLIKNKVIPNIFNSEFSLVEPDAIYRLEALKRLGHYTRSPIVMLDKNLSLMSHLHKFDLILANHVLYYVDDFKSTMDAFFECKSSNGKLIISMSEKRHALCHLLQEFCNLNEVEYPYYVASDLLNYLDKNSIQYKSKHVLSELRFKNSVENLDKIVRFILSNKYAHLKSESILKQFREKFSVGEDLVFPLHDIIVSI